MFDFIKQIWQDNPAVTALLGVSSAGLISFILSKSKQIYSFIREFIFKHITTELTVFGDFYSFTAITTFIHRIKKKQMRKILFNVYVFDFESIEDIESKLELGFGSHFIIYKKTLILVTLSEKNMTVSSNRGRQSNLTLSLVFFTRNNEKVYNFIKDVDQYYRDTRSDHYHTQFYVQNRMDSGRMFYIKKDKRYFDSIFLSESLKNHIKNIINNFINNYDFYRKMRIPFHLGILLYGPPGTGKTSIIKAIAGEFNLKVFSFNKLSLLQEQLFDFQTDPIYRKRPGLIVIEDMDLFRETNKRNNRNTEGDSHIIKTQLEDFNNDIKQSDLNMLLNSIDGLESNENFIIIGTTNNIDSLEPALIRPGRFDHLIEIGYVNEEVFNQIYYYYYQDNVDFTKMSLKSNTSTVAELQNDFLLRLSKEEFFNKYIIEKEC